MAAMLAVELSATMMKAKFAAPVAATLLGSRGMLQQALVIIASEAWAPVPKVLALNPNQPFQSNKMPMAERTKLLVTAFRVGQCVRCGV